MKNLAAVLVGAAAVAPAFAQEYRTHQLDAPSTMTQRYCLPPCTCVPYEHTGPMSGRMRVAFTGSDPQYNYYTVNLVDWTGQVNGTSVPVGGSGQYRISRPLGVWHRMELDLVVGAEPVRHYDSGSVGVGPHHLFPKIKITLQNEVADCLQNVLVVVASPVACYPDCNKDASLTAADLSCFQTLFVAADPYADCDGDGGFTVADFGCFQSSFVAGCP